MDPPSILARSGGFVRSAWHHGGPTAPFIHVVTAFCFVLPKIFMEARLIDVGFLSQGKRKRPSATSQTLGVMVVSKTDKSFDKLRPVLDTFNSVFAILLLIALSSVF